MEEVSQSNRLLHYIAGKNMWGKKMRIVGNEPSVAIAPDQFFIFLPDIFLPSSRSAWPD
tara:strand:+ start:1279 stop:1455 length:177 start_codon:yes stop_codon:yes gene_type:complete